jgi:hypothetical protein
MLLQRATEDHTPSYLLVGGKVTGRYEYNYKAIPPSSYYGTGEWEVITRFERFGNGKQRQADFSVGVCWRDVESIIETLCEAGCSQALAVRDAMKLAAAAKELGWHPPTAAAATQAAA